jgi:hypothetical protein
MVNDQGLDRATPPFDLESEAIHHIHHGGDHVVVLGIIGRQIVTFRKHRTEKRFSIEIVPMDIKKEM